MQLGWQIPQEERGLWQLVVNEKVIDLEGKGMFELRPGVDPPIRRTRACNNGSCIRSVRPMPCALFHLRRVTSKVFEIGVHGTRALTPFLSTQLFLQPFVTIGDYRRIKGAGGGPSIRFCRLQCPGGQP